MFAFIYHYWSDHPKQPRYQDMANPVVVSIATLRYHLPTVPVYVVDISDSPGDWGPFPQRLRFKVVKQPPSIPIAFDRSQGMFDKHLHLTYNTLRYCSSTFDVTEQATRIPQDHIIFSDSDIFYLKPLDLQPKDRFNCRDGFVGYYYYDKTIPKIAKFIELWKACILKGITDRDYRKSVTRYYRIPNFMNQESAYLYLCRTAQVSDVVRPLSPSQHCFELDHPSDVLDFFHFIGDHFGSQRGLAAFAIAEYHAMLTDVLGEHGMRMIFQLDPARGGTVRFADRRRLAGHRLNTFFD